MELRSKGSPFPDTMHDVVIENDGEVFALTSRKYEPLIMRLPIMIELLDNHRRSLVNKLEIISEDQIIQMTKKEINLIERILKHAEGL